MTGPTRSGNRTSTRKRVAYVTRTVLPRDDLEPGSGCAHLARTVSVVKDDPEPAELSVPRGRLALSVAETAQALGVSRTLIHQACRSGQLHSVTVGTRRIIPVASLKVWLGS